MKFRILMKTINMQISTLYVSYNIQHTKLNHYLKNCKTNCELKRFKV